MSAGQSVKNIHGFTIFKDGNCENFQEVVGRNSNTSNISYITQEEFSFPLISQQNVTTGKRQFPGENGGIAVTAAQCVKRFGTLRRYHKS